MGSQFARKPTARGGRALSRPPTRTRDATERPAAPASHPHSGQYALVRNSRVATRLSAVVVVVLVSAMSASSGGSAVAHARLVALDLATGAQRWSVPLPNVEVVDSPIVGGQGVSVRSATPGGDLCNRQHSTLASFDVKTGRLLWRAQDVWPQGAVDQVVVVFPQRAAYDVKAARILEGLDTRSGKRAWTTRGQYFLTNLAVAGPLDRVVLVAGGALGGLDSRTGRKIWSVPLPPNNGGSSTVRDGALFVLGINGPRVIGEVPPVFLTALDTASGLQRWQVPVVGGVGEVAAVASVVVAALSTRGPGASPTTLVGFDSANGDELWRRDTDLRAWQLQSDQQFVYAGSVDGRLEAVDPKTGETRWSVSLDAFGNLPSVVGAADGTILVHWYRHLVALDASDGHERWRTTAGLSNELIPAAMGNGLVYAVKNAAPCQQSD
jgi:outer membrane protein assembly factor BamB